MRQSKCVSHARLPCAAFTRQSSSSLSCSRVQCGSWHKHSFASADTGVLSAPDVPSADCLIQQQWFADMLDLGNRAA